MLGAEQRLRRLDTGEPMKAKPTPTTNRYEAMRDAGPLLCEQQVVAFVFLCYITHQPHNFMVHMLSVEPTADHPLPFDLSDEEPKTHKDGVAIAVNTVDLLEELGASIDYTDTDLHAAKDLITGTEKPNAPKTISVSAQAKAAQVLIKEFDFQAFADVHQARNFITNKLVSLADCGDTRIEIKALELLGKHSDIGLFTERSEVTIKHTTSEALEKSIRERVKRLLNADVTDITPLDDLDAQLGTQNEETTTQDAQPEGN